MLVYSKDLRGQDAQTARRSTRSVRRQHTALENLEDITDRLKEACGPVQRAQVMSPLPNQEVAALDFESDRCKR